MTVELNEKNSEFLEKLFEEVEIYYGTESYDTLVNMIIKEYREYLPFLLQIGRKGTNEFRQVASDASKIK